MAKPHLHGAAALAATALLHAAPTLADAGRLEGAAAWRALVGNTVVTTTTGGSYTEFYAPGGEVRRQDPDGATVGQWTENGDQVCFDYPDDDEHVCVRVTLQGSSGTFTDPGGAADAFQLLPGNAKNL